MAMVIRGFCVPAPNLGKPNRTSRRAFLFGLGVTGASLLNFPSMAARNDASVSVSGVNLADIKPEDIVAEYRARGLDKLSDSRFINAVGRMVSRPSHGGMTGFTLNAPWEVMARGTLLPHVSQKDREMARIQLLAVAVIYQAGISPTEFPRLRQKPYTDLDDARREIRGALIASSPDRLEAAGIRAARQFGLNNMIGLFAPFALTSLSGSVSSPVAFWQAYRYGFVDGALAGEHLLRAVLRRMGSEPKAVMRSFTSERIQGRESLDMAPADLQSLVFDKLRRPPAAPGNEGSVRFLVQSSERSRVPEMLFKEVMSKELSDAQISAAFRAQMRIAAHSMLQEAPTNAKFGWSQALTLPRAVWGLAGFSSPRSALASALVLSTSFRSSFKVTYNELNPEFRPDPVTGTFSDALNSGPQQAAGYAWYAPASERMMIQNQLANEAAVRNDHHLVGYVQACFDCCRLDPEAAGLYLSAGAYLTSMWIKDSPRKTLTENLNGGRYAPILSEKG